MRSKAAARSSCQGDMPCKLLILKPIPKDAYVQLGGQGVLLFAIHLRCTNPPDTEMPCAAVVARQAAAARELEMARAAEEGRQRAKAKPGSLVINPDGYTYSYAVKIEAVSEGSTSRHSRTGSQALEGDESKGAAQAADRQPSDELSAEAGDKAGAGCVAQGSSSQRPQASDGGPLLSLHVARTAVETEREEGLSDVYPHTHRVLDKVLAAKDASIPGTQQQHPQRPMQ